MGRLLPILAIVGAALAVLAALVLAPPLNAVVPLFALVCAVILMLQRTPVGMAAGAVVGILSIVAILGVLSSVNIRGNDASFGISPEVGDALAIASGAALAAAVIGMLWDRTTPLIGGIGLAAALLATVLALVWRASMSDHAAGRTILVALLCAATIVPAAMMLRAGSDAHAGTRKESSTPPAR